MMKSILLRITILVLLCSYQVSSYPQCVAGFTDSIDSLTVYFTSTATGSFNSIGYDYGDGNFELNNANPTYTYSSAGFYEVCQWIQDTLSFTCFDFTCDTLVLGDATCSADFYWFANELEVEYFPVAFGTSDSLVWDFGDGTTSNDSFPLHTYAAPGWFTVCLSLYDSNSLCDSTCYQLYVDSGSSCEADFVYTANDLAVTFSNLSSGSYDAVYWDFGDGLGSSEQINPNYTYLLAGTYEVCLIIYDTLSGSCYDEYCEFITVTGGGGGGGGCEADFEYTTDELKINVSNTSSGSFLTAFWDYGDGSGLSLDEFHTYDEPGEYEVCLTIGNIIPFCFDEYCQTVQVVVYDCETNFEYSFNESNVFSFSNTTVGTFDEVLWEFGDGNTSTFTSPSYTYNLPGTYKVCLTTFDNGSPCGEYCMNIEVYPLGVSESPIAGSFKVVPNPSDGNFILQAEGYLHDDIYQYKVLDMGGRVLFSKEALVQNGSLAINADLPSGAYFIQVANRSNLLQTLPILVR